MVVFPFSTPVNQGYEFEGRIHALPAPGKVHLYHVCPNGPSTGSHLNPKTEDLFLQLPNLQSLTDCALSLSTVVPDLIH